MRFNILLKHMALLLILSVAYGCTRSPNCSDEQVIVLLKELICKQLKDPANKVYFTQLDSNNIDKEIERFVNDCVEVKWIRPTSINEDIQKCNCQADITFKLTAAMKDFVERDQTARKMFAIVNAMTPKESFEYSAQITEQDGAYLLVEAKFTEELLSVMRIYLMLKSKSE